MHMVDDLTPYYQDRMRPLPPTQRKIVEFLCLQGKPTTVKDIANALPDVASDHRQTDRRTRDGRVRQKDAPWAQHLLRARRAVDAHLHRGQGQQDPALPPVRRVSSPLVHHARTRAAAGDVPTRAPCLRAGSRPRGRGGALLPGRPSPTIRRCTSHRSRGVLGRRGLSWYGHDSGNPGTRRRRHRRLPQMGVGSRRSGRRRICDSRRVRSRRSRATTTPTSNTGSPARTSWRVGSSRPWPPSTGRSPSTATTSPTCASEPMSCYSSSVSRRRSWMRKPCSTASSRPLAQPPTDHQGTSRSGSCGQCGNQREGSCATCAGRAGRLALSVELLPGPRPARRGPLTGRRKHWTSTPTTKGHTMFGASRSSNWRTTVARARNSATSPPITRTPSSPTADSPIRCCIPTTLRKRSRSPTISSKSRRTASTRTPSVVWP